MVWGDDSKWCFGVMIGVGNPIPLLIPLPISCFRRYRYTEHLVLAFRLLLGFDVRLVLDKSVPGFQVMAWGDDSG